MYKETLFFVQLLYFEGRFQVRGQKQAAKECLRYSYQGWWTRPPKITIWQRKSQNDGSLSCKVSSPTPDQGIGCTKTVGTQYRWVDSIMTSASFVPVLVQTCGKHTYPAKKMPLMIGLIIATGHEDRVGGIPNYEWFSNNDREILQESPFCYDSLWALRSVL